MKRKNIYLLTALLLSVMLSCFLYAFAHSGRTDANGGHWDRKAGTYHFHTGEHAGKNSGGGSSSEYVPFTPPYDPPTDNPYRKDSTGSGKKNKGSGVSDFIGWAIVILFGVYCAVVTVCSVCGIIYDNLLEKHLPKYKIAVFNKKINALRQNRAEWAELRDTMSTVLRISQIPMAYEIGEDSLPRDKKRRSKWGRTFTLYRTSNGKKLHTAYNCCSATRPTHVWWYRNDSNFSARLCKRCAENYIVPDLSWYGNYLTKERNMERLDTLDANAKILCQEIHASYKICNSRATKFLVKFSKKNKASLQEANELYRRVFKRG